MLSLQLLQTFPAVHWFAFLIEKTQHTNKQNQNGINRRKKKKILLTSTLSADPNYYAC